MVRDEAPSRAADDQAEARRVRYERPVLRRLGSVNRVTLAQAAGSFTDGMLRSTTKTVG
jgi:hypothetical protein